MSNNCCLCLSQPIQLRSKFPNRFRARNGTLRFSSISARLGDSSPTDQSNPQVNLSVLRFTLGIPGLDESYLPRWIGYGFGSLLVLNHFFGSNLASDITSAQLRTEALGLSLAAFSVVLPYLGKFLKGATLVGQTSIPEDSEQIFVMSENVSNVQREELAWATYVLLRNTNSFAVLISVEGELCARGYWNTPNKLSKSKLLDWFTAEIEKLDLSDVKSTLYFPQISDSELWEILPKGTRSVVVQPLREELNKGFILLASTISYAYTEKDRAWIKALAKKFGGNTT